jgi:molybdate transport system substrate-binding protein
LIGAVTEIDAAFVAAHPDVQIDAPNFQGSQALVTAIQAGAHADVVATSGTADMGTLTGAGTVATDTAKAFAGNKLAIVVKAGNPKGIQGLADLARPGVAVVLADPSIPVGTQTAQILARAGVALSPTSVELRPAAVLAAVATGTADGGIVNRTDVVAGGSGVTGVAIPDAQSVVTPYWIAPLRNADNAPVAQAYVAFVLSGQGQAILQELGFLPAT